MGLAPENLEAVITGVPWCILTPKALVDFHPKKGLNFTRSSPDQPSSAFVNLSDSFPSGWMLETSCRVNLGPRLHPSCHSCHSYCYMSLFWFRIHHNHNVDSRFRFQGTWILNLCLLSPFHKIRGGQHLGRGHATVISRYKDLSSTLLTIAVSANLHYRSVS